LKNSIDDSFQQPCKIQGANEVRQDTEIPEAQRWLV